MKHFILTFAAFIMAMSLSAADITPMSHNIAKKLKLTEDQKWSIEDINYDYKVSNDKWNASQRDYENSLKTVLSAEQFAKYKKLRDKEIADEKAYKERQENLANMAYR